MVTFAAATTPDHEEKPSYAFTVVATSGTLTDERAVTVDVANLDDTAPVLSRSGTRAALDEGAYPAETETGYTFSASDADNLGSLVLSVGGDSRFGLNPNLALVILAGSGFDHEDANDRSILLTVTVTDGANHTDTEEVEIILGDVNDEPPEFAATGTASVDENTGAGLVVYTPEAAVPDVSGDAVVYRLSGTDAADFTIDSGTGALTLTGDPDFEAKPLYSVVVTAVTREGREDERSAAQAVTVEVANLNDVAPEITSGASGTALVENTEVAATEAVYTAAGTHDLTPMAWSLKTGLDDDAALFEIDSESGAVTFAAATTPDHEAKSSYAFTVVATSGTLTDELEVTVDVTNLDDTAPEIGVSGTQTDLEEGTFPEPTDTGYRVSATDADGLGGLTFFADDSRFEIDSDGRLLIVAGSSFDHESGEGPVTLTVGVADGADHADSADVTVVFGDVNDTAPDFAATGTAGVDENSGAGLVVYTPEAAVPDVAGDAVVYRLSGTDAADFTIDSGTGALTLTGDPDHEAKPGYSVVVTAVTREGGADERSAEQAVTVDVANLNDVSPQITSGASGAALVENTEVAATEAVYTATGDYDLTPIAWSLKTGLGDDAALFEINGGTGAVTFRADRTPDHEAKSSYAFTVVATSGTLTDELAVTVDVTNLDDTAPVLSRSGTQADLDEGAYSADTETGYSFSASDADNLGSLVLSVSGDSRFGLDSSGALVILEDSGVRPRGRERPVDPADGDGDGRCEPHRHRRCGDCPWRCERRSAGLRSHRDGVHPGEQWQESGGVHAGRGGAGRGHGFRGVPAVRDGLGELQDQFRDG